MTATAATERGPEQTAPRPSDGSPRADRSPGDVTITALSHAALMLWSLVVIVPTLSAPCTSASVHARSM